MDEGLMLHQRSVGRVREERSGWQQGSCPAVSWIYLPRYFFNYGPRVLGRSVLTKHGLSLSSSKQAATLLEKFIQGLGVYRKKQLLCLFRLWIQTAWIECLMNTQLGANQNIECVYKCWTTLPVLLLLHCRQNLCPKLLHHLLFWILLLILSSVNVHCSVNIILP